MRLTVLKRIKHLETARNAVPPVTLLVDNKSLVILRHSKFQRHAYRFSNGVMGFKRYEFRLFLHHSYFTHVMEKYVEK